MESSCPSEEVSASRPPSSLAAATPRRANQTLRIGVTPGPHAQILEAVKPIAAQKGLDIQILEFSDYVVPNAALYAGEFEANSFQHQPYLDNQKADRGYKIESVAQTVNFPIGIYSKKHKSWDDVPDGATIAIPNDPTNGGRPLLLLQDKGIIKLKADVGFKPTVADIAENPKNELRRDRCRPGPARPWTTWTPRSSTPTTRHRRA